MKTKKRVLLILSTVILILCASMSFYGCSGQRQKKLSLTSVYQTSYGDIILDIKNTDVIKEDDKIEISLNGGISWKETEVRREINFSGDDNKKYYYYSYENLKVGKSYSVAARIAGNDELKSGKRSNVKKIKVKEIFDNSEDIFGGTLGDYLFGTKEYYDKYLLSENDECLRIDKYEYYDVGGESEKKQVAEEDRLQFEYIIVDKKISLQKYQSYLEGMIDKGDYVTEQEYADALEFYSVLIKCIEDYSDNKITDGWLDYDNDKGILKDEEFQKANSGVSDNSKKWICVIIRVKGSKSTLASPINMLIFELS